MARPRHQVSEVRIGNGDQVWGAGLGGKGCLALESLCNRYYMSKLFHWNSSADDSMVPLTPRQLAGKDPRPTSREENRGCSGQNYEELPA